MSLSETREKMREEINIIEKIENEMEWIDIKPYSHNIIGLSLSVLQEDFEWTDKDIAELVFQLGLDKMGWGYLVKDL